MSITTTHDDPVPDGWTVVASYTPTHSVTPWNYYGMLWHRRIRESLTAAGIDSKALETRYRITHPHGTGPGGRVRFGDDMVPSLYQIAVRATDASRAKLQIQKSKSD